MSKGNKLPIWTQYLRQRLHTPYFGQSPCIYHQTKTDQESEECLVSSSRNNSYTLRFENSQMQAADEVCRHCYTKIMTLGMILLLFYDHYDLVDTLHQYCSQHKAVTQLLLTAQSSNTNIAYKTRATPLKILTTHSSVYAIK